MTNEVTDRIEPSKQAVHGVGGKNQSAEPQIAFHLDQSKAARLAGARRDWSARGRLRARGKRPKMAPPVATLTPVSPVFFLRVVSFILLSCRIVCFYLT